ncbi:hypothetical protein ACFW04_002211 [Cataglyphis niger]
MVTSAAVHLLTAWEFSEEIIGRFVDQEIEADQFKNLTEEDLKILIPNIGPRRKFQNNIKKYLNEIFIFCITINLESILKKSEDGQLLLSLYKNEGKLNKGQRNKLAKIIVSNELSPNISNIIRSERTSFLSDHVSVWYIKNKKGESQDRGKILTKYYFTRRKLIKADLLNVKAIADFAHIQTDNEENDDDNIMNYEEYMLWLKNNCRPWQIVNEYWSLTSKKRLKDFQTDNNQSCHEYIIQFPALSDPLGYVLVGMMFGNKRFDVDNADNIIIDGIRYAGTPGLYELIFKRIPDEVIYTDDDKQTYKSMLLTTRAHKDNQRCARSNME